MSNPQDVRMAVNEEVIDLGRVTGITSDLVKHFQLKLWVVYFPYLITVTMESTPSHPTSCGSVPTVSSTLIPDGQKLFSILSFLVYQPPPPPFHSLVILSMWSLPSIFHNSFSVSHKHQASIFLWAGTRRSEEDSEYKRLLLVLSEKHPIRLLCHPPHAICIT